MVTSWAAGVVAATDQALRPLADPARAVSMTAYMKDRFAFLGVAAPDRRRAQRAAWAGLPTPTEGQLTDAVRRLWRLPEREFQYAGCDLLTRHNRICGPGFLPTTAAELITAKSWWDSVDSLNSAVVGPLALRRRELREVMRTWIGADDIWLTRSAIIHQLGYRAETDPELLFELCATRATDQEFFIAKAIGWALRDYSYTDAAAVVAFIDIHPELSPLSRREGLKAIKRRAQN